MKGRLYIDGKDAYTEYGVYVVQGGWNELIAYPPLKPVATNDWQEEDGIEADLSSPVLDSRDIALRVAFSGIYSSFDQFIALLSDGAYHTFECTYIRRRYRLRLVSLPNFEEAELLGMATLKLADDFPMRNYSYIAPMSNTYTVNDYSFDGYPFTRYGVRILRGTHNEVMKTPDVKQNLLRNIETNAGVLYDGKTVTYKSKDVKLQCLLRADTLNELWRNYDALLYDLTRPDERMLEADGNEFPFYYRSCQITEFYPNGKIWLQFSITITVTGNLRLLSNFIALHSEDDMAIQTENEYLIEI